MTITVLAKAFLFFFKSLSLFIEDLRDVGN